MELLVVLLALLFERFHNPKKLHRFGWFSSYLDHFKKLPFDSWLFLLSVLAPLFLALSLLFALTNHRLYGLLDMLLTLCCVLYCFGPENIFSQLTAYLDARKLGSSVEVAVSEKIILGYSSRTFLEADQAIIRKLLIQLNRNLFSVLFWLMIMGPIFVVTYRLLCLLSAQGHKKAERLARYVEWLPARCLALFYALCGNFKASFETLRDQVLQGIEVNDTILKICGCSALDTAEKSPSSELSSIKRVHQMGQLIDRSLFLFVFCYALAIFI